MNSDLSIINYKNKGFKFFIGIVGVIILIPTLYLASFFYGNLEVYNSGGKKGKILVIYTPFSSLFNYRNREKFIETFKQTDWELHMSLPNFNAPVDLQDYSIVVINIQTLLGQPMFLVSNYLNALHSMNNKGFITLISNDNYFLAKSHAHKLINAKGGYVFNTLETSSSLGFDNGEKLAKEIINLSENYLVSIDALKLENLENISAIIANYYTARGTLPTSISDIINRESKLDITYTNLDYEIISDHTYKLCTDFTWNFWDFPRETKYKDVSHKFGYSCYLLDARNRVFNTKQLLTWDKIRIEDLKNLENEIKEYASQHFKFPDNLQELKTIVTDINLNDPETKQEYTYKTIDKDKFTLCSKFTEETDLKHYISNEGLTCFEINPLMGTFFNTPDKQ